MLFAAAGHTYGSAGDFLYGEVYAADGSSGTASTENSYGGLIAYRIGVSGEIATEHADWASHPELTPGQIYLANSDSGTDYPASFNTSVNADWTVPVSAGQEVVAIIQTYSGQFGWGGDSYCAAAKGVIAASTPITIFHDMQLGKIPRPQAETISSTSVALTWTGMSNDPDNLIMGYTVYRSLSPDGTYEPSTTIAPHTAGGTVTFSDNAVTMGASYYYKIAVNYEWDGVGNTVPAYVTLAKSEHSDEVAIPGATKTFTPTNTVSHTATATQTITQTATTTASPTFTATVTITSTVTVSPTKTATLQPTATATKTAVPAHSVIIKEKVIVFNNPVKNSVIKVGFMAENDGEAIFEFFGISGELIRKERVNAVKGANIFERKFEKMAPGVYIVKIRVDGRFLPDRKIGFIK